MHCVDLGESFPTTIFLQNLASIQPRTSPFKFARSPRTDPPGAAIPRVLAEQDQARPGSVRARILDPAPALLQRLGIAFAAAAEAEQELLVVRHVLGARDPLLSGQNRFCADRNGLPREAPRRLAQGHSSCSRQLHLALATERPCACTYHEGPPNAL